MMIDVSFVMRFFITILFVYLLYRLIKKYGHLLPYGYHYLLIQFHSRWFIYRRHSFADLFADRVASSSSSIAIRWDNSRTYSFTDVDRITDGIANIALLSGLKPRDTVALLMENRPEYLFIWIGLAKIGVITAFINNNLKGEPLMHSIKAASPKAIIVGTECMTNINEIIDQLTNNNNNNNHNNNNNNNNNNYNTDNNVNISINGNKDIKFFHFSSYETNASTSTSLLSPSSSSSSIPSFFRDLSKELSSTPLEYTKNDLLRIRQSHKINSSDILFYIYTSGTTGLPKAARITHSRYYLAAASFSTFFRIKSSDRVYICMPLYHSAAGIIGTGFMMYAGASLLIKKKFSASNFFKDCVENHITVIQYIGQIARYLLNTPPTPFDQMHQIKIAIGNGMGDAWIPFQKRFHIPAIGEFFAATEGNANLINNQNKPHAIGYIPYLASLVYPVRIVQFDLKKEVPYRDPSTGVCCECTAGEVGEMLGKIRSGDPLSRFDGYTNNKATEDKIIRNVFKKGDAWFRTGDLMMKDSEGFIYFCDRIGDTFRWKGENVSTVEVENILSKAIGVKEVNVYGVTVPGNDGRAGMACMVVDNDQITSSSLSPSSSSSSGLFSLTSFYDHIRLSMPPYQQPLFIRFQNEMTTTGTFKLRKADLVKEGFDPANTHSDPIYFRDDRSKSFVLVTKALFKQLMEGGMRL